MRVLHTSDWHIGRTLYDRKRYEEFDTFLTWLAETIQPSEINALLVAGDVFDTSAPSNRAQELYYLFLCRVDASSCRNVVVVAGNHDSPSLLNAPKELLKALDIYVVGSSTESPEDEVLVLRNVQDTSELIVCAVRYLRDRDIRVVEAGESVEDKERKLIDAIRTHYAAVAALAEQKREDILIVAMGHLFIEDQRDRCLVSNRHELIPSWTKFNLEDLQYREAFSSRSMYLRKRSPSRHKYCHSSEF